MDEYVSLSATRTYLQFSDSNVSDDPIILQFVRDASRAIRQQTHRDFLPRQKTYKFDLPDDYDQLRTDLDILELKGLSDLNGTQSIPVSVALLSAGNDYNLTPYNNITLNNNSGSLFNFSGTTQQAVWIDAITGFRENYETEGWIDTGASLTASATSKIITLSVSGSAGVNELGHTPRFTPQMLLKVDSEFIYIDSITDASTLNVVRHVRGTTGASHASGTQVYMFSIEPEIDFLTKRLAAWGYMQQNNPFGNTLAAPQFGTIEIPSSWPEDVKERIKKYTTKTLKKAY